jgi:opacity protein-like surface antigen
MQRFSRSLFLALATLAALLLAASSSASASEFEASELPATISGSFSGSGWKLAVEGGEVTCASSLSGTLSEFSSSLTLTPTFSECVALGAAATVKAEGCKFVVKGGSETAEQETYAVTTDVSCESGKAIKISTSACALEVGSQSGLSGRKANDETQTAPESTTLEGGAGKVVYTVTTDDFLCSLVGTGKKENGELKGSVTLAASTEHGEEAGFALADAEVAALKFTGATELRVGSADFPTAGDWEIREQYLKFGNLGFKLTKTSIESCGNPFTVKVGERKVCAFNIQATNVPMGTDEVLVTAWAPKGAKVAQVIRSWVYRP